MADVSLSRSVFRLSPAHFHHIVSLHPYAVPMQSIASSLTMEDSLGEKIKF